jgi:hypothetical protein
MIVAYAVNVFQLFGKYQQIEAIGNTVYNIQKIFLKIKLYRIINIKLYRIIKKENN